MLFDRYKKLSALKKNVLSGSILAGTNICLMLIAYPIYLKYLGSELYGLWATISIIVFFSRLGDLGINNALIKYVAAEFGRNNYVKIKEYSATSVFILIIPSILILLVLFIFTPEIVTMLRLKPEYAGIAKKIIPLVGLLSIFILFTELVKGILMGLGRIDIANYIFLSGQIIRVVTSIVLIIGGFGIWSLYWGNVISSVLIFVVYMFILRFIHKIKIFNINNITKQCCSELLTFGGTIFSARIVSMLIEPFNKVIISRYIGLAEVSYYEIGLRGASQLRSLYEMGLKAIMPRVSELQQKTVNFRQAIAKIHKKCLLFIALFALPVFILLFILSNIVLSLWLKERYNPQISTVLRWFLFAYIINLLTVPSYYIFMGIGKAKYCFLAHLITSVSNIIIISILIASNIKGFSLFIGIQSFSVILSAAIMILLFIRFYRRSIPNNQKVKEVINIRVAYC